MAERRQALLISLLVVAALAGFYWGVQLLPWRYEEVDHGFTDEARRNPFLAAKLFLEQQNVPVSSARGLSHLDDLPAPEGGVLLIYSTEGILSSVQTERLWHWVEQGGHLIINANSFNDLSNGENRSPLLQRLGVAVRPVAGKSDRGRDRFFNTFSLFFDHRQGKCPDEEQVMEIEFKNEPENLKIALNSNAYLENRGKLESVAAVNNDGAQLMRYFIGAGMVTLVTDMGFWSNSYIACYDHAYLLWKMIGDGEVLILSHAYVPSLFTLLWQKAALAVTLLLLLLLAWLWRRSRRFGPLLLENHSRRRSLMEHLHASAMFSWRRGAITESIEALRRSIRARMILHHPGYKQLTRDEQYLLIARLTAIDPNEVSRVMSEAVTAKPQQLTELVQSLQQIRNRI